MAEKDLHKPLSELVMADSTLRAEHEPIDDSSNSISSSDAIKDAGFDTRKPNLEQGEKMDADHAHRTLTTSTGLSALSATTEDDPPPSKPWHRRLNPLKWTPPPPPPKHRIVSREYGAGRLSRLTFGWVGPLMDLGYRRILEPNDIWMVNPDRQADVLAAKLTTSFQRRLARGDRYPLLWAIHETFKIEFWTGGACAALASVLGVLSPFTLRFLIQFAQEAYVAQRTGGSSPALAQGIGLVFGITGMQMLQSFATNHFIYRGMMIGGQTRGVLISVIFEKAMRISGRAKAGGRAIDQEAEKEKRELMTAVSQNQGFLSRWLANKVAPTGGPKHAPNAAIGVSGDGVGWANGRVVNLMSTDTYRVDQASALFHMMWTSPLAILITLVVLLINLTYSALSGFALLVIGLPLLTKAIKVLIARRRAINKLTDQRVSLTQEILQAVRFVKYFGWELSFLQRLSEIRKREIRSIQTLLSIRNGINAVSMSLPIFASMLSFITYSLSNHSLNPARVFSSLALFNSIRMPLNLLPMVLGQVTDAWASIGRIQDFLTAEEQKDDVIWDSSAKDAVVVENGHFTWERTATRDPDQTFQTNGQVKAAKQAEKEHQKAKKAATKQAKKTSKQEAQPVKAGVESASIGSEAEPFQLHNMNLSVRRHELLAVIGTVGSGKSSLLAALAGDMRATNGSIRLGASRAFCPQYAWIQNATVRENILFGKEMDREWYEKVIDACALRPDLEMLPHGDLTEIGERGITVSGGQKQRLNIARAIYFNSDVVLMDDPLSAVDAHVGRHIFDEAICGLLKDKCRILATHQLHVLHRCDRIIWLQDGRIESIDTYENLIRSNEAFQQLMSSTALEEQEVPNLSKKDAKTRKRSTKGAALMQQEERAVRSVSWDVYAAYVRATGSLLSAPGMIVLLVLAQCANIATSLWLSYWVSNVFGYSTGAYMGVYAVLGIAQAFLMFTFSVSLTILGTTSSKVMLHRAMKRVLRAPMSFFDTTPLGRITNRFSKDVDIMDNSLTDAIRMFLFTLAMIISVFTLIIVFFHFFAVALGPLFLMFILSAGYYRASAREVKRHESVLRSVVFARFTEAVSGTASIRAYGLQAQFVGTLNAAIDDMNAAYYLTFANQRWLSIRLDAIGNLLVFTTGILVVTSRFSVSPSIAGVVLSYILGIVQLIQFTVRQLSEVENAMNATERLHYYGTQLEEEAPLHQTPVPPSWPASGAITFNNVHMRYRDGLPLVLQGLDLRIAPGERLGIVGRTGAGKSSILSALFRLVELSEGSIAIDDINISTIGLQDLRNRLAIIPQDPTLFRGTVRSNLDPFGEHSDLDLWAALRQANLVDGDFAGTSSPASPTAAAAAPHHSHARMHLDAPVEEEGLNFSLGQRQLMALARALVRGSRIIVCDEATSSVDIDTDAKIQATIRQAFAGRTLLCIAHRLRTILAYDRICVMDAGRIAEIDTPKRLWDARGVFWSMCVRSGIREGDFEDGEEKAMQIDGERSKMRR